jgi:hypothetical protein
MPVEKEQEPADVAYVCRLPLCILFFSSRQAYLDGLWRGRHDLLIACCRQRKCPGINCEDLHEALFSIWIMKTLRVSCSPPRSDKYSLYLHTRKPDRFTESALPSQRPRHSIAGRANVLG